MSDRDLFELLEHALEQPADERRAWLEREAAGDPDLLREALAMLAADEHSTGGEFEPPPLPSLDFPQVPERVGPYTLRRRLGEGGMGSVHLAVRTDGAFHRQVAIKLVRPGFDEVGMLARFERERQVLANLEHAGIARLIDGGSTSDGAPYIVMEYVEGVPIDRWCDENRLTLRERIALFCSVCESVHHAHLRLVVHRDLKPNNVLVKTDGTPKLLDFGIAKVLDPEKLAAGGEVTREWSSFMTPAYASPEQLRGFPVTPASDQYSLGVLLYRLLTGHLPYDFPTTSRAEIERVVCESEPRRPSQAVAHTRKLPVATRAGDIAFLTPERVAERRRSEPRSLRRALAGDLDRILLMALRKEPGRRYASVEGLAQDLRRYLAGRPVQARRATLAYRATRSIARHRLSSALAALLFAALLGGILFTQLQARAVHAAEADGRAQSLIAQRSSEQLRATMKTLLFGLNRELRGMPNAEKANERSLRTAIEFLERQEAADGADAELLFLLCDSYRQLGELTAGIGSSADALASFRLATEYGKRLCLEGGPSAQHRSSAALAEVGIASFLQARSRASEAVEHLERARALLGEGDASDAGFLPRAAQVDQLLGLIAQELGDRAAGIRHLDDAIAKLELAEAGDPLMAPMYRGDRALALALQARLLADAHEYERAQLQARTAVRLLDEVADIHPLNKESQMASLASRTTLASVEAVTGDVEPALETLDEILADMRTLTEASPANLILKRDYATALYRHAEVLRRAARHAQALASLEEAIRLWRDFPDGDRTAARSLAADRLTQVRSFIALDRLDEAEEAALEAHTTLVELQRRDSALVGLSLGAASALLELCAIELERHRRATPDARPAHAERAREIMAQADRSLEPLRATMVIPPGYVARRAQVAELLEGAD